MAATHAQKLRKGVQIGFLITALWIGVEFFRFVGQFESGPPFPVSRPAGVEAFLPISSLISLKHWILTGTLNPIHPAGLFIFLMVLSTALVLKKGFCSWVCPFGLLSEYLAKIHGRLFVKPVQIPKWLDIPLRSLKYLLLLFFLYVILIQMDARALEMFIYSPYNRVADIKMLRFFTQISTFSLVTIILLFILSILRRHFWCRYLCPYGALLGVLSLLSITRIRRQESTCTHCEKCTRSCPSDIAVHRVTFVSSDECHACMKCMDACPVPHTLGLSLAGRSTVVKPWVYAAAVIVLFAGGSTVLKTGGLWQNAIGMKEYAFHIRHLHLPVYRHHRGSVPVYDPELFPHPDRFQKNVFQKREEVVNGTHRDPGPRASGDPPGTGPLRGG